MNVLDVEIARFFQTSEISFHFSGGDDEYQFAYDYFKAHASEQLSPKALGRLLQDLKMQNIKGFTRTYKQAKHVVKSAVKTRYIATTLDDDVRVSSLLKKLEQRNISIKRNMEPPEKTNTLLKKFRLGVIFVPDAEPKDISSLTLHYALPAPAFLHVMRDTVAAWGYDGDYPAFQKNTLAKVTVSLTDDDPEQQEMIAWGKTETARDHKHLVKEEG